jgi:RNA polymerase sigma-70 factor (ECF subfamily)
MEDTFEQELLTALPFARAFTFSFLRSQSFQHAPGVYDPEDYVQMACEAAIRYRHTYAAGTSMRSWLCSIIRNKIHRQRLLDKGKDDRGNVPVETAEITHADELCVDPRQGLSDELAAVERALDSLPEERRIAAHLVLVLGYSYEEAAEVLECGPSTIGSRVARARAEMVEMLTRDEDSSLAAKPTPRVQWRPRTGPEAGGPSTLVPGRSAPHRPKPPRQAERRLVPRMGRSQSRTRRPGRGDLGTIC